jgi:hypothetical protein
MPLWHGRCYVLWAAAGGFTMLSTSREWRLAELEAIKNYDPAKIVEMYAQIPCEHAIGPSRRHVSFSRMIEAIVDAEELAPDDSEATSLAAN